MAFASVNSLAVTILSLVKSPRVSVASSTQEILLSRLLPVILSLHDALERFDSIENCSGGVMAADARIRKEVRLLEDAIESDASAQFHSQSQTDYSLSLDLSHLEPHIHRFIQTAEEMEAEYIQELYIEEEEEEEAAFPNASDGKDSEIVGLTDQFLEIRNALVEDGGEGHFTASISGMAGIGKTTLARKIFHDPMIEACFECRAFVEVGRKYRDEEILQAIIAQMNLDDGGMIVGDEDLQDSLHRSLRGKKYFIVLDDIWGDDFYNEFSKKLPYESNNASRILIITRETRIVEILSGFFYTYRMRFLNEEESWDLLRKNVFDEEEECLFQLVKVGRKIAENCEGLPLLIVTIARILSKSPKSLDYWNEVEAMRNSVFEDALDQMYEVLLPSYQFIPQYLKTCFLYMVVFPRKFVVKRSRIIKLREAEGYLDPFIPLGFDDLDSRNLVVVHESGKTSFHVKSCSLHIAYRYLSRREAKNIEFLHILNRYGDCSIQSVRSQRCLIIYKNVFFAIKEVRNIVASNATLRSVLCTGPYHQYQVPVYLEWKLLRILDALTIRFYEFPIEVVKLIHLRYLALTCNGSLPPSISKLWNLQHLIIHQHMNIKHIDVKSYVPKEIWFLTQLKHLQLIGRDLPHPPMAAFLPSLTQLLDVGIQSCDKQVLERIPNLEKLRVQVELPPNASSISSFFDHICCLRKLKSLQSVVKNPSFSITSSLPLCIDTSGLHKLTLTGLGYPWKDMIKIAGLPSLEVLKLKCYAFRGEKWEAKDMRFPRLTYLLIEETDLVEWSIGDETFPKLFRLAMKKCHKFKEIPLLPSLYSIELVDCSPLAGICAEESYSSASQWVKFSAFCSWK